MDPDQGKSSLRKPFITTANALANLYKTAAAAEQEARDAGARAAYMNVMQWAARKSRRSESFSTAEVIAMCGSELAKIPPSAPTRDDDVGPVAPPPPRALAPVQENRRTSQRNASPDSCAMRDDPLVSEVRKMGLNPRKRQRTAISETFIRACEDSGNGNLFSMGSAGLRGDFGDYTVRRRDSGDETEGGRETRAQNASTRGGSEPRKTRSGRLNIIEKQRRK